MFTIHLENDGERWHASVGEIPGTLATGATALSALARSHRLARDAIAASPSRREFLLGSLAGSFVAAVGGCGANRSVARPPAEPARDARITLEVNGTRRSVTVDPRSTLLDVLREHLGLTGSKKGCDRGECGACTVHIDGRRANACMALAIMQEGKRITTVEGLARGDELHPVQAAFIEHDAFQCGYCTSGQIMSAAACIAEGHAGDADEVRAWMSGNLCRCSAYPNIVAAVLAARGRGGER
jgi:xanthine dehydrogenase YagT iron-sulfur-binding subunit